MQYILTEQKDKVLIIKLNRPDKFNSFHRAMAMELISVLENAKTGKNIRAVLLTGEGKAFCAGQDLAEAISENGPSIETIVKEHYNPIILAIRNLPKPVVCYVNGVAAGAGANIALACDVVLAAPSASFIQAFSKIGLIPDSAGTFFLPRLVGFGKASAWMMLGEKVSASEAEKQGMIYKICSSDEQGFSEALSIAVTLSEMPTAGIWLTKELLNKSWNNSLEDQLKEEMKSQVKAASTYDYKEGVKAFLEKRKPVFRGE
jgi:2-(1,2-epoxy-1,2-dihydrophenyl)acetyl-CoA isomerase